MRQISLGKGVLTWNREERVSDRYGTVYLMEEGHTSLTTKSSPSLVGAETPTLSGKKGKLVAVVLEARESTHIGDMFRGIRPRTPGVGQSIELGEGLLFTEPAYDGGLIVGLQPIDERNSDWLDPRALYDAHEQTVELFFLTA
jgi:hypothetical protein